MATERESKSPRTANVHDRHGGWIGVDLDGTLAQYDHWRGIDHIGTPIPKMHSRVMQWLDEGKDVSIFTARVANGPEAIGYIEAWCQYWLGRRLPVTNVKDMKMYELWDDRAVQVIKNAGVRVDGK